ncbi:Allophanate hydrolase [Cupriavidus yeoncheonensis]|uniref:Allophanate hydrolase n=1 Tax=Cupriavidus yeoncheonensis TaxID=1462994 RepID=A0A916IV45_9BURK|nr:allophanate hydrolase [Cupriavidus yeoncheonensis]CAG2136782.1 Allophanate hydrolase [Cupriavidus yeoncheonensis]
MTDHSTAMPFSLDIASLQADYRHGRRTPVDVVEAVIAATADDPHRAWIHRLDAQALRRRARELLACNPSDLPLYGIPFAIKDNIDLAGCPTTAACPAYAYTPQHSAFVVQRLLDAGAIAIGKTNLDQFATGLNGTRSPYGACRNAFDAAHVSGGSSSGSAVAVALGHVSFALGTDTAGSGRVPAAFNHLVGLKPTCGVLSATGVVPACRSLDTVSIFALTANDAHRVFAAARGYDGADAFSRHALPHGFDFGGAATFRLGVPVPAQLGQLGPGYADAWARSLAHARGLGAELIEIDIAPFLEAARLLYDGPWVAERYQAIRAFIDAQPEAVFPVTRQITLGGAVPSAADAFAASYRLRELRRVCDAVWDQVDGFMLPTAPQHPTVDDMLAEPVRLNGDLGRFTNFMNLLDYAGIAVPAGFTEAGLPFGVTVVAPAHQDVPLLRLATRWQQALRGRAATLGATGRSLPDDAAPLAAIRSGQVRVAVCGAHLQGQPLHHQLTERGARLVARTRTAPCYRLHALPGDGPQRPGLVRVDDGGAAIEVEVWELPEASFGSFVAGIPAPLGIGRTQLADGASVPGFICEPAGLAGAEDITAYGGWRAWLAREGAGQP